MSAEADSNSSSVADSSSSSSSSSSAAPAAKKREAEDKAKGGKKQKKADGSAEHKVVEEYQLNFNKAVDREHEGKSISEIIKLPPSALQGLAGKADAMLASFNIKTIEQLASWKFYKIARSIAVLAQCEEKGKRDAKALSNINGALDKEYEHSSLKDLLKAKVSALQGLADWADSTLAPLQVKTIADLSKWKYAEWASALVELAAYENSDFSS